MQDQGKRLLLAVAAALGVLLLFQFVFPKKEEPKPDAGSGSGSATAQASKPSGEARLDVGPCRAAEMMPAPTRGKEEILELNFPNQFKAKFSNYGGELISWKLADPRFERDATKGELLPQHDKHPDRGAFGLGMSCDSTYQLPLHAEWKATPVSSTEVTYTFSNDMFTVEKNYKIVPDAYSVRMTAKISMKVPDGKEAYQTLVLTNYEQQELKDADKGGSSQAMARSWHSSSFHNGSVYQTPITDMVKDQASGMLRHQKEIRWSGFEHPYLFVAFAPKPENPAVSMFEKWATLDGPLMADGVYWPRVTVKRGDAPMTREVFAFLGPKNYKDLERADEVSGFETHLKAPIDLGWFAFIGRPLMWLLFKFQSVVVNWGIAIVLLTFLVKGATLYWTTKSMRSMKAMAALAPEMKKLQAKYKDDKQRLQAETMALYKTHNVNPIAGCLPILLQMPIWLALYRMLSSAGELYQQPFIGGWIDDLTAPDPTHVLPAILVVTMFVQARLTPATGDSTQQKIMQYGMPLMFGVMSFFFPAGLTLYIFTNTLLSALHSIYMNKFDKKSLEIMARSKAAEAAAKAEAAAAEEAAKKKAEKAEGKKPASKADKVEKKASNGVTKAPKSEKTEIASESDGESSELDESSDESEGSESESESALASQGSKRRRKKRRR